MGKPVMYGFAYMYVHLLNHSLTKHLCLDHNFNCEQKSEEKLLLRLSRNSSISCMLEFKPREVSGYFIDNI